MVTVSSLLYHPLHSVLCSWILTVRGVLFGAVNILTENGYQVLHAREVIVSSDRASMYSTQVFKHKRP